MQIHRMRLRVEAFRKGVSALRGAGINSAALDASILLGHVTGQSPGAAILTKDLALTAEELDRFENLIKRRCNRETVSRLVGTKEFFSLSFRTSPDVLDPRPETEVLVQGAKDFLRGLAGGPKILDVGTGSGVIAVTLALADPRVFVVATDICPKALKIAMANAGDHGVSGRTHFVRTDVVSGFSPAGQFDLLVSNPPYIAAEEFPFLPPEVRLGDPYRALVAGPEGTEFFKPLAEAAGSMLRPGGSIMVEVGAGQSPGVENLFRSCGIRKVSTLKDLAGIGRVVKGER